MLTAAIWLAWWGANLGLALLIDEAQNVRRYGQLYFLAFSSFLLAATLATVAVNR